jgi:hypothetical protein
MTDKYKNGKIYRLVCEDGHYYYGSTTQLKLNLVFNNHKIISKNNRTRLYQHINTIGWDKVYIELVEEYSCNNKGELTLKETAYINNSNTDFLCLNNEIEEDEIEEDDEIEEEDEFEEDEFEEDEFEEDEFEDDDESMSIYSNIDYNKYNNGKIYKLVCKDEHYYIGSTIKTLQERFNSHKYCINNNIQYKNYKHFNTVPLEEISIELIENYPCNSKNELREREDYYIQLSLSDKFCLNTYRALQTDDEKKEYDKLYYTLHKDKAKENMKKYYEENKDTIMEYHQKYNEENKDIISQKRAEYRKNNSKMLSEKQKQYALEHSEQVKEARKKYNLEHKEQIIQYWKEYNNREENKEKIKEYKRKSAQKIKEQNADKIAKEREEKKKTREDKTQERLKYDNTIVKCECGGTYQNYRKKRHDESKKHTNFIYSTQ